MAEVVLWHITFSNFNEKARWALDWKRVPHVRRAPPTGSHILLAPLLSRGAQRTFPLLTIAGQSIGDSTAIIAELERRYPEPPLYPSDPEEQRRALELEDFFDENYGHEVRRLAFWQLLSDDEAAAATAREVMGEWAVRLAPRIRSFLWNYYGITEDTAKRARELVIAGFDRIEAERSGGEYLVGDRFSVADLAAAALAGPLLSPPEFAWKPKGELPSGFVRARTELAEHPAADWIRRMYAKHRLPSGVRTATFARARPAQTEPAQQGPGAPVG